MLFFRAKIHNSFYASAVVPAPIKDDDFASRREMRLGQGEAISLTPLESRLLDYLIEGNQHRLELVLSISVITGFGAVGNQRFEKSGRKGND